ncbi:rhomboid family intramembrane serine protease [Rubinisphaera margarita]|uniref:rhomboid family intramembrane serine protease n=1 Tax=Rubinisphaera margarita TaxID=2909586 RepID=UPI001EE80688|nr:rhomboid family intramembrane serine protease [Rubinisphaera margarita]MCG6156802.1 rhomboid family intramembrane serine protease [Rubinisphaera margarita]
MGSGGGDWPVWKKLILITVIAFVGQLFFPLVNIWFDLASEAVLQGQIWRLLTYAFLHDPGNLFHLLFNMLLIYFFGRRLESMYGSREFGLFYCAAAIFAGLCYVAWSMAMADLTPAVGASGAAVALVFLYALHFPREQVMLWGLIAVQMRWLAGFILLVDLLPVLSELGGRGSTDQIAHMAHLGGILFAFLYFKFRLRLAPLTTSFGSSGARRNPKLKIYRDEDPQVMEQEVDRILQKIAEKGEASLTSKERKTLTQASERYKNRKS